MTFGKTDVGDNDDESDADDADSDCATTTTNRSCTVYCSSMTADDI